LISKSYFRPDLEHPYLFEANNPLRWLDPSGSNPTDDAWKAWSEWLSEYCDKCGPIANIQILLGIGGDDNFACGTCAQKACDYLKQAVPGSFCDVSCFFGAGFLPIIHCISYLYVDGQELYFNSWDPCPSIYPHIQPTIPCSYEDAKRCML